jgi:hypothetical protein
MNSVLVLLVIARLLCQRTNTNNGGGIKAKME